MAEPKVPPEPGAPTSPPERLRIDAGSAADALLTIPADERRERVFQVSVLATVRALPGARAPTHELRVLADGELQWSRRIATDDSGGYDSLDYGFRCTVAVAREMRIQALVECEGGERLRLVVEADEVG